MANIFVNPDTWAQAVNGPIYGSWLSGYLAVNADAGALWDTAVLQMVANDAVAGVYRATLGGTPSFEGRTHGFVRRENVLEDVGNSAFVFVEAVVSIDVVNGPRPMGMTAAHGLVDSVGVMARVQGGTLVEDAVGDLRPVTYIDQPKFYAARIVPSGDDLEVRLERWNAGAVTVLDTFTLTPWSTALFEPGTIRLECQNSVSDVTLTVKVQNIATSQTVSGINGPNTPGADGRQGTREEWGVVQLGFSTFTTLITYSDTSGSRIPTQGRAGFIIDKENEATIDPMGTGSSLVQMVNYCHLLSVTGINAGIYLRDEWVRAHYVGRFNTNRFGAFGVRIESDIEGDHMSDRFINVHLNPYTGGDTWVGANGYQGALLEDGTTAGIEAVLPQNSPAQSMQLAVANVVPADAANQRWRLDFQLLAQAGKGQLRAGLVLRASQSGGSGAASGLLGYKEGYQFRVSGTGVCSVRRKRWDVNSSALPTDDDTTTIATATISLSQAVHELQAEVTDDVGPDPPGEGPVIIRMWVDQVLVVLVATGAGVTDDGAGIVRDASAERIRGAALVALYASWPSTGAGVTETVEFREITEDVAVPPTTGGGGPAIDDDAVPSIPLESEQAGKFGNLGAVFSPSWSMPIEELHQHATAQYSSGTRARWALVTAHRRGRTVHGEGMSDEARGDLVAFYASHGGQALPFTWTPAGDVVGVWKFTSGITWERVGRNADGSVWRCDFSVWEVLA